MTEFELKVCGNCAAFGMQFQHGQDVESKDDGACRLNPPANISIGTGGEFATLFPSVNREDWCLAWTRKGETA